MDNRKISAKIRRLFKSTVFSLFFLLLVIAMLAYAAYRITQSVQEEPDFGGMVTIRQADLGINGDLSSEGTKLSRAMILKFITGEKVLTETAAKYHWDIPYADMLEGVDVKERLSTQNSYIVVVNTRNVVRSMQIARALSLAFLEEYRKGWMVRSRKKLTVCDEKIRKYETELLDLKKLRERMQDRNDLQPLNTETEMEALNTQLVEAQKQFFSSYAAYMTRLEEKRTAFRLEYDLACQVRTSDDAGIVNMRRQLEELDRQCEELRKQMTEEKPNIYQMKAEYPKLNGLPNDILYFYENIQKLQQLKLGMLLGSIIDDKENALDHERKKKTTIERLLDSNSCDVFLREIGR